MAPGSWNIFASSSGIFDMDFLIVAFMFLLSFLCGQYLLFFIGLIVSMANVSASHELIFSNVFSVAWLICVEACFFLAFLTCAACCSSKFGDLTFPNFVELGKRKAAFAL